MRVVVGNVEHDVKVVGALSCPRLGFMDNYFCSIQAFTRFGIPLMKGTGAFWDQTMHRLLHEHCKEEHGNEFIITMDYDSVFEPDCVSRLIAAAIISGYDAVAPLQTKRDDQRLMFTPKGLDGKTGEVTLPNEWWEKQVQPADSAHFGLTVLRCSAIRRLKKPWFLGVPNEDGGWEDLPDDKTPRTDPDVYFWRNWRESGNTLGVSPQVAIGHAELVITWPSQRLKGIHQYPNDYWNGGGRRPPEAWGSLEHLENSEARA